MPDSTNDRSQREKQLDAIIAEYYEAADQGRPPNQAQFLARHSEKFWDRDQIWVEDSKRSDMDMETTIRIKQACLGKKSQASWGLQEQIVDIT